MARSDFGGTPGDTLFEPIVNPGREAVFAGSDDDPAMADIWRTETSTPPLSDLLLNGAAVTQLPILGDAQIPVFQAPDGVNDSVWISVNGGPRRILRAAGGGGGGSPITDNGDGTLTISGKTFYSKAAIDDLLADLQDTVDANSAAIGGNTAAIAALLPNGIIVVWDGSHWLYKGDVITARPTADTDYVMIALFGSTKPSFALDTDVWLQEL